MPDTAREQRPPLRQPSSPTLSAATMVVCIAAVILGQSTQNLAAPLWHKRMEGLTAHPDPFVQLLVIILWYPGLFFVTCAVTGAVVRGRSPLGFLTRYSPAQHVAISLTGLVNAVNGMLVLSASPSTRTPAIVASLIGATTLVPMIIIKHYFFRVGTLQPYRDPRFVLMVLCYLGAAYSLVFPLINIEINRTDATPAGGGHAWWLVYFVGAICGQLYNMQQEHSFKSWSHSTVPDYLDYLFHQAWHMCLWGWGLCWLDLIPGFGLAAEVGLWRTIRDTVRASFLPPALAWNVAFNLGLYGTYIAACVVNQSDALIVTVCQVAVPAIVTAISYPFPDLTPDRSVVMIALVPLTILLFGMATYIYDVWVRAHRPYDGPTRRRRDVERLLLLPLEGGEGGEGGEALAMA